VAAQGAVRPCGPSSATTYCILVLGGLLALIAFPAEARAESLDQADDGLVSEYESPVDVTIDLESDHWGSTDQVSMNPSDLPGSMVDGEMELDPDIVPGEGEIPEGAEVQELPSGFQGKSGVTPQALALPDGSGSIQGMGESFTPNLNTGSGSFSVPISLPPGRRGLQPQIGLAYTTGSGDGPLGWGWSYGVPFISRQTDKGLPRYDDTDRFMYNGGQELVPIATSAGSMPEGEDWPYHVWDPDTNDIVYYRARIEGGFMRFFFNRTLDTWLVQDRQGNHYFYGETEAEKTVGPKGTFQWSLSRLADVRRVKTDGGNDVHYVYLEDGRTLYIQDIYWNSFGQDYGDLASYQHQVHFVYELRPDATVSFGTGFKQEQNLRLTRIEVRSYQVAPSSPSRPLTRVYLLTYEDETISFHSRLVRVQVCGRDFVDESEKGTCLPPLELQYSQIEDLSGETEPIEGFGYLNSLVQDFGVSPDVSVEDPNVDLLDVNQDGLPDLLITKPEYFGSDHAAILNDGHMNLDEESSLVEIENPAGWSLTLDNLNVSVLDMDGSGNADLLHMPYAEQYHYYRLTDVECGGAEYCWKETAPIPLNDGIDFTADADDIRLVDLNNDHLIDVMRTTGTRMEHFLNLSAYPGHQGQFGIIDEDGDPVPNESINTCLLKRGTVMQFHDGNLYFADMNGDGLQDLIDMKSGSIAYWPGRGYGQWGDSDEDCEPEGPAAEGLEIEMEFSPNFSNPDNEGVMVADVNGDGLGDLVQIRFDAVDIWLNRDGRSFAERHIIEDTPHTNSGFYGRVRLADVNGSGTVDILWANAGGYQYIDLGGDYRVQDGNGGYPAGLLEQVENGLGGTTLIEYSSSVELMIDAKDEFDAWDTVAPMPLTVVKRVTTLDNLDLVGGPLGRYVKEFVYRDPYYDPREAEFKGFGYAESWDRDVEEGLASCDEDSIKLGNAPIVSRNWFHRGVRPECMEEAPNPAWGPNTQACADALHTDNPFLGLTGASIMSDAYSPCTGEINSVTVSQIEVRRLFESVDPKDDRNVYFIVPNHGLIYKYDPPETLAGDGTPEEVESIRLTDQGDEELAIDFEYTPASPDNTFHRVDGWTETDDHGYPTEAYYGGFHRYSGAPLYEHANCDQYTQHFGVSYDDETWVHQAVDSYLVGASPEDGIGDCDNNCPAAQPCNQMHKEYTDYGELHYSTVTYNDYPGSPDTDAHSFVAALKEYNEFGQVVHEYAGCNLAADPGSCMRHTENVYEDEDDGDLYYSAYIRQEVAHVTGAALDRFVFRARWDAGTAQIVQMVSADGSEAAVGYDAVGRYKNAYGSHPETGQLCPEPIKTVVYHYETAPMPYLETWVNTSPESCGSDRWEVLYTWVDGLGQPYATAAPGDKHLGSAAAYPWLVSGLATLNAKGGVVESCESMPIAAPPEDPEGLVSLQYSTKASLAATMLSSKWNCSRQEFDAWGRTTLGYAADGTMAKAEYGIDSGNAYDHLDLTDPGHVGTFASERVDGLGRSVEKITRHKEGEGDEIVERKVEVHYNAQGAPIVVTREEGGVRVSRRASYDTLGRMRLNQDLNFGTWEYRYDTIGQLIGTTNPLGQDAEYYYDGAGRLRAEYYGASVEPETEYFYDVAPDASALWPMGVPAEWGGYPSDAVTMGRLVAVKDRSGVTVSAGNWGTFTETWRQVYPDERLYHFETLVNAAGELEYSQDPDGHRATAEYYDEGTIKSSYWTDDADDPDKYQIIRETRSNYVGQIELVKYGDAAQTESWSGYDPVTHRALATVVQQLDAPGDEPPDKATLMAFGYYYDELGKLLEIADWRGRGSGSLSTMSPHVLHPTAINTARPGYHQAAFPSEFDTELTAPMNWNPGELTYPQTGWPIGAAPSDAAFDYDTLYQLRGEDREYVTGDGNDVYLEYDAQRRAKGLTWNFDSLGSMSTWTDDPIDEEDDPAVENLGRALGGTIKNGYQFNLENGCDMDALGKGDPVSPDCRRPDALYFATNIGDLGVHPEKGTCVWVEYDNAGRMVEQLIRTACNQCYENIAQAMSSSCDDFPGVGLPEDPDYEPPLTSETIRYEYTWNALGQLALATKYLNSLEQLTMSYVYDASGARVIREKSAIAVDPDDIRQDLYISGGYELRQVQLQDDGSNPVSVGTDTPIDLHYASLNGTRLVKYSSGLRIQWKWNELEAALGDQQMFLSFSNHLGSTSAVVDYSDGTLVEWRTNYAYGADESHWKNTSDDSLNPGTPKYDNAEEPYGFTGKEEDKEVGLHYFGARYYSAYLGRWLSPDPPVVHRIGVTNYYLYGGNSPYIFIDPDGNFINFIAAAIGAAVGAIGGFVSGMATGQGLARSFAMAGVGAAIGFAAGVTCGAAVPALAAAMGGGLGATISAGAIVGGAVGAASGFGNAYANARIMGASPMEALKGTGIAAGWGSLTGSISGGGGAALGLTGISEAARVGICLGAGATLSAQVTVTQAAIDTGFDLSEADWEDIVKNYAISQTIAVASGVGASLATSGYSEQVAIGDSVTRTVTPDSDSDVILDVDSTLSPEKLVYTVDPGAQNCLGYAFHPQGHAIAIQPGSSLNDFAASQGGHWRMAVPADLANGEAFRTEGTIVLQMEVGADPETPIELVPPIGGKKQPDYPIYHVQVVEDSNIFTHGAMFEYTEVVGHQVHDPNHPLFGAPYDVKGTASPVGPQRDLAVPHFWKEIDNTGIYPVEVRKSNYWIFEPN